MITITLSCAQCGKLMHPEMDFSADEISVRSINKRLEDSESNWRVEENGGNNDAYCSDDCASGDPDL